MRLPNNATPVFETIVNDHIRFFPYFRNCIGALDGCHVQIAVPMEKQAAYRNRFLFLLLIF
jgi:hypothetical protein